MRPRVEKEFSALTERLLQEILVQVKFIDETYSQIYSELWKRYSQLIPIVADQNRLMLLQRTALRLIDSKPKDIKKHELNINALLVESDKSCILINTAAKNNLLQTPTNLVTPNIIENFDKFMLARIAELAASKDLPKDTIKALTDILQCVISDYKAIEISLRKFDSLLCGLIATTIKTAENNERGFDVLEAYLNGCGISANNDPSPDKTRAVALLLSPSVKRELSEMNKPIESSILPRLDTQSSGGKLTLDEMKARVNHKLKSMGAGSVSKTPSTVFKPAKAKDQKAPAQKEVKTRKSFFGSK